MRIAKISSKTFRNNSSPRGDGNRPVFGCTNQNTSETTHPREGTEMVLPVLSHTRNKETTHPREGTEISFDLSSVPPGPGNNSSPRGDGNNNSVVLPHKVNRNNSSPRGDGNYVQRAIGKVIPSGNNSSPRGDGNEITGKINAGLQMKQLIPARGRKSVKCDLHHASDGNNSSPRGDGNKLLAAPFTCPDQKQLIPARGRKSSPGVQNFNFFH